IAQEVHRREEKGSRIAKPDRRSHAGVQALGRQRAQYDGRARDGDLPGTAGDRHTRPDAYSRHGADGERRMRHHAGARHRISGDPPGIFRDEIEAAVPEAVLLDAVTDEPFAPVVHALRGATEAQSITGVAQPIAHVVVVSVAQTLVEEADALQR